MIKNGENKKCLICNKEYYVPKVRIKTSRYCSFNCRIKGQNTELNPLIKIKILNCAGCGKQKKVKPSCKAKYCSIKCSRKNQSQKKLNKITKECLFCKKEYKIHKYRKNTSKYCSVDCFNNQRNQILNCPSCKKNFKSPKYEKRKYCSEECFAKGFNKRKSQFSEEIIEFIKNEQIFIETEFAIYNNVRNYYPDIKIKNKLIECYGDYWHCNPIKFSGTYYHTKKRKIANEIWKYDKERIDFLNSLGYEVLVIWENDWNQQKDIMKNKILNYLNNEI